MRFLPWVIVFVALRLFLRWLLSCSVGSILHVFSKSQCCSWHVCVALVVAAISHGAALQFGSEFATSCPISLTISMAAMNAMQAIKKP